MNEDIKKQIGEWHAADRHREIINALEQIPDVERDYDTICLLARAYGATGTHNSYIDMIVYDFSAFVRAVQSLLKQYSQLDFYLSEFRPHAALTQMSYMVS